MKNRRLRMPFATIAALALLVGCGASSSKEAANIVGSVTATSGISPERCEANKKAGSITYLTGYDYAAAAGIIDVVVADQLGYFKKMCLSRHIFLKYPS